MGIFDWLLGSRTPSRTRPDRTVAAAGESAPTEAPADPSPDITRIVSLRGIGERTARNLAAAGLSSVDTIAAATDDELLSVPGVGPTTAARLKAYATGEPIPVISAAKPELDGDGQPTRAFNASRGIDRGIHEMLGLCRGVASRETMAGERYMTTGHSRIRQWVEERMGSHPR